MKLYYVPYTRASRPRWMLEELGLPYELVRLDPKKGDNKGPDYLRVHPLGKVPALVDGEVTLFESAAIVLYLADKAGRLAPQAGSTLRAEYYQWILFGVTTLEPPLASVDAHTRSLPEEKRVARVAEEGRVTFAEAARAVEKRLEGRDWLLGEFSGADVLVGSVLWWARATKLLGGHPILEAYVDRIKARPAWQRSRAD